jgi:hypothetical protein
VRIEDSGQSGTGNGDRGEVAAARRRGAYSSDTMLGIDWLYSLGAKGHNI